MEITVQFSMKLPVKVTKRPKWFIASCPILDIFSQGETEKQAKNNLAEALTLFFISCFERGTLDSVLKESGFKPAHLQHAYHPPEEPWDADNFIDLPIPFLVNQPDRLECQV